MKSAVILIAVTSFVGMLAGERALLAGQEQEQDNFGESIDVRVVNVEAVVTDKSGHRVKGLGTADFRLLVDGKEMPLEYFTEVDEGRAVAAGETPGEVAPAVTSDGAVGRSILIFIDESFAIAPQRNQVLDKIGKSLERLGPEDQVAIVAFNGHQLDLLTSWTKDPQEIASTLAVARKRKSFGQFIRAQRHLLDIALSRAAATRGTGSIDMGPGLVNNFAAGNEGSGGRFAAGRFADPSAGPNLDGNPEWDPMDLTTPVKNVVAAACAAMRGMSPSGGRKVMLLLSGGWPLLPREVLSPSLLAPISAWMQRGINEKDYQPLSDTANRLGYTLYPVDVPGLDAGSTGADVQQEELTPITGWSSTEWERATHSTLQLLASETGGQPVFNSARLQALDRMAEDTGSYYWIGFTPAWKADDQRHSIRLEARRPGLRIRSRNGFSDVSRRTQLSMKTESLLLFGDSVLMKDPASSGLEVELGKPKRLGVSTYRMPVTLMIPAKALTLVPAANGYTAELTLSVGAIDRWGGRSDLPQINIRLDIPNQPEPDTVLSYRTAVTMRRADQRIVFTVRDALTGETVWDTLSYKP